MQLLARRQIGRLEVAHLDGTGDGFAPHFHDEFVLGVNLAGRERIVLDRRALDAGAREMTLYNPGQVQSSNAPDGGWRFLSLYVEPAAFADLLGLPPETVFDRPVLRNDAAAARMTGAILRALDPDVSAEEAAEELVATMDMLLELAGSRTASASCAHPPALRRVAEQLCEEPAPPSLAELARGAGLTPVQLVRLFSRAYGLPPFAWAANRRLVAARSRLKRGEAIAAVAADLGFADQAHLTRRFRAIFGAPPGRWRRD